MDLKTLMSFGRFKNIVMILVKYGFDDLVDRLNIPGTKFMRKTSPIDKPMDTFERIRYACEELGPTFVKFGQLVSLRPDLVPPPLIDELSKLQDDVAPLDISQISEVIEQSTGKPLKETFAVFDVAPIAAASISQVHRGVLAADGRIVSIKVQRPGIQAMMRTDLDILAILAHQLHERVDELKSFDLPNLVRLIRKTLLRELDFRKEARNMKIARAHAGEAAEVYIPQVYEAYCSEHLLVMEFIQGAKLKDFKSESIADPELLARQGLVAAIDQILEHGFFHADPHPGNILITEDGRMCLIDWGMTGRLLERDRHQLIGLLKAVLEKDGEAIVYTLLHVSHAEAAIDQKGKRGRIKKSKSRNLLERLRDFEDDVLRFMENEQVAFSNNPGENDIRMTKIQQKISGCFRSIEGAKIFCRIRSYLSTCRKQGIKASRALELLFNGKLPELKK
jgi:ubiquinone biosynthesis protein